MRNSGLAYNLEKQAQEVGGDDLPDRKLSLYNFLGNNTNTMSAFFSGTDDANENMTQFYGVWGKVTDDKPMFTFRYVAGNSKIVCDPSVLFEWPKTAYKSSTVVTETVRVVGDASFVDLDLSANEITRVLDAVVEEREMELIAGPFKMLDYPADWMAQHSLPKYTPVTYTGSSYGRGYYNNTIPAKQTDLFDYEEEFPYRNLYTDDWDDYYGYSKPPASKKLQGVNQKEETEKLSFDDLEAMLEDAVTVSQIGVIPLSRETQIAFTDIAREIVLVEEDIAEFEN